MGRRAGACENRATGTSVLSSACSCAATSRSPAATVAALSHPNILAIFDFGTHEGTAYAVTELLEGETLRGKLDTGPIAQKQAVDYALQVARGLRGAARRLDQDAPAGGGHPQPPGWYLQPLVNSVNIFAWVRFSTVGIRNEHNIPPIKNAARVKINPSDINTARMFPAFAPMDLRIPTAPTFLRYCPSDKIV